MILQLNPSIPLWHTATQQPCEAILVLDYSKDDDIVLLVIRRDGELWAYRTSELRGVENLTFGRRK